MNTKTISVLNNAGRTLYAPGGLELRPGLNQKVPEAAFLKAFFNADGTPTTTGARFVSPSASGPALLLPLVPSAVLTLPQDLALEALATASPEDKARLAAIEQVETRAPVLEAIRKLLSSWGKQQASVSPTPQAAPTPAPAPAAAAPSKEPKGGKPAPALPPQAAPAPSMEPIPAPTAQTAEPVPAPVVSAMPSQAAVSTPQAEPKPEATAAAAAGAPEKPQSKPRGHQGK